VVLGAVLVFLASPTSPPYSPDRARLPFWSFFWRRAVANSFTFFSIFRLLKPSKWIFFFGSSERVCLDRFSPGGPIALTYLCILLNFETPPFARTIKQFLCSNTSCCSVLARGPKDIPMRFRLKSDVLSPASHSPILQLKYYAASPFLWQTSRIR